MRNIINNIISFLIAVVGLIGSIIWILKAPWEPEPIILGAVSLLEIIGFIILRNTESEPGTNEGDSFGGVKTNQKVNVNVNVNSVEPKKVASQMSASERNALVEPKKAKVHILFIDDDKKFDVVKILKDSGWKNTKTVTDIKNLEVPVVKQADILFVDINGVGKVMHLEYEGLDLALMLKQKYPDKKVVIYSAKKDSNSFHSAWDLIDFKLEKNALPYQFQNIVEKFSLEYYN